MRHIPKTFVVAAAVMIAAFTISPLIAADKTQDAAKADPVKKKLTGADLYAINCNRCHPDRFPVEWKSAQGKTIITHMRVRANIPAEQANLILKYLQEESGN